MKVKNLFIKQSLKDIDAMTDYYAKVQALS